MSSSISLTVSPDGEQENKRISKDNFHLQLSPSKSEIAHEPHKRCHTMGLSTGATETGEPVRHFEQEDATRKLRRWRHHDDRRRSQSPESQEGSQSEFDFYAEVDDRMSRNSVEYPAQQAKYLDRWLAEAATTAAAAGARSKSFDVDAEERSLGPNVVGIRGFSSDSFIAETKRCREDYARLKQDYLRLQLDHRKLRDRLAGDHDADGPPRSRGSRRRADSGDVDALRALVIRQGRRLEEMTFALAGAACERCNVTGAAQNEALMGELRRESERLRQALQDRDREVRQLNDRLASSQFEPTNRRAVALAGENARLKSASEADQLERARLRADYVQLEARLRSLMESQRGLSREQGGELEATLSELCRLQVSQPKLEMLLETERQIKGQLQDKIVGLQEAQERLQEQTAELERELSSARLRARAQHSNELDECRAELAAWQAKCQRLEGESASAEAMQRASKARLAQLDARLQAEVQQVRESHQRELEQARTDARRSESECGALRAELARLSTKWEKCTAELRESLEEVHGLRLKLELVESAKPRMEDQTRSLQDSRQELARVGQQLAGCELSKRELASQLELTQSELEQLRRQLADVKRRFETQQQCLGETSGQKERELARLRADLNFERYNRQVSLRGLEKELRSSLRELEAMKCRFSRRLTAGTAGEPLTSHSCHRAACPSAQGGKQQEQSVTSTARPCGRQRATAAAKLILEPSMGQKGGAAER